MAPVIHSPAYIQVFENHSLGIQNPIYQFNATDRDGQPLYYGLVSGYTIADGTRAQFMIWA